MPPHQEHSAGTPQVPPVPPRSGLSRRQVLRGAAAAGAGVVLSSGLLDRIEASAGALAVEEYDVVVVGSGAAGMTAALAAANRGLRCVVVEKAPTFGGSAARSGAGIWAPCNEVILAAGVPDTPTKAAAYLARVAGGAVPDRWAGGFPGERPGHDLVRDPEQPAALPVDGGLFGLLPRVARGDAGRAFHRAGSVGRQRSRRGARPSECALHGRSRRPGRTGADYKWLVLAAVNARGTAVAAKVAARHAAALLAGKKPLAMGQALAAGLRAGLLDAGVPVWRNTPLLDLQFSSGGRVTGVLVSRNGAHVLVKAARGVIVGTGGFEHNASMRDEFQRHPIGTDWTVGAKENTGDGIAAGQRAGAALDLMDDAWWGPTIPLPDQPYFCLAERTLPGSILVDGTGRRFVNEAAPYHDVVNAMYDRNATEPAIPAWLIVDQRYRNRYLFRDSPRYCRCPPRGTRAAPSSRPRRSARWRRRSASRRRLCATPSPASTVTRGLARTSTSVAATASTTATTPTRPSSRTPASLHCGCHPSTPSRSSPVTSAPRVGCAPTPEPGCCGRTARQSPACMRPATPAAPSWATATRGRERPSARP